MASLMSVLAYGFIMILHYEKQGDTMPFDVFETIITRQAVLAVAALAVTRSTLILILYGKGSTE